MSHRIYLSYDISDSFTAKRIIHALSEAGLTVLTAPRSKNMQIEMLRALNEVTSVIALLSNNAMHSQRCQAEIEYAQKTGKQVLPVLIAKVDSPPEFETEIYSLVAPTISEMDAFVRYIKTSIAANTQQANVDSDYAQLILNLPDEYVPKQRSYKTTMKIAAGLAILFLVYYGITEFATRRNYPPAVIPDGWQVIESSRVSIAVPADWTTVENEDMIDNAFDMMSQSDNGIALAVRICTGANQGRGNGLHRCGYVYRGDGQCR